MSPSRSHDNSRMAAQGQMFHTDATCLLWGCRGHWSVLAEMPSPQTHTRRNAPCRPPPGPQASGVHTSLECPPPRPPPYSPECTRGLVLNREELAAGRGSRSPRSPGDCPPAGRGPVVRHQCPSGLGGGVVLAPADTFLQGRAPLSTAGHPALPRGSVW